MSEAKRVQTFNPAATEAASLRGSSGGGDLRALGAGEGHAGSGNPFSSWMRRSNSASEGDGRGRMDRGTARAGQRPVFFGLNLHLILFSQVAPLSLCPLSPFF